MNKKLMALAVAGALAAPAVAFAQASNVTIYGRANLGIDNYSAKGATAGSASDWDNRTRVFDNGSRLGFRGEENLGGGLKALFLMETGVAMDRGDGNGQSGAANTSVGLGARMAYVGLAGSWGQLNFGKQNVYWGNGQHEQWQANYGTVGNQFYTGGMGRGMGTGVARQQNTMMYISPVWNGVNISVAYAPQAQETAAAGTEADGYVFGTTIQGNHARGIIWAWDHVDNKLNTPTLTAAQSTACAVPGSTRIGCGQAKAQGDKFRGGWLYQPGANISLFYIKQVAKNGGSSAAASATGIVDATTSKLSQDGWGVVWEHTWGNFAVEANYSKLSNIEGCTVSATCDATNNSTYFLGGRYNLSKRTSLMAFYLHYRNDRNYNADPVAGGMSSVVGALATGADPRVYGVGLQHNF